MKQGPDMIMSGIIEHIKYRLNGFFRALGEMATPRKTPKVKSVTTPIIPAHENHMSFMSRSEGAATNFSYLVELDVTSQTRIVGTFHGVLSCTSSRLCGCADMIFDRACYQVVMEEFLKWL